MQIETAPSGSRSLASDAIRVTVSPVVDETVGVMGSTFIDGTLVAKCRHMCTVRRGIRHDEP